MAKAMTEPTHLIPPELMAGDEPLSAEEVAALAGALDEPHELPSEEVRRWRIEDDGAAEWACRKLALALEEQTRIREQAGEWREPIDTWEAAQLKPLLATEAFFRAHLEGYALRVRDASAGEIKTVALPSGKVGTREAPARLTVEDEGALVQWARENAPAIVSERVLLTDLGTVAKPVAVTTLAQLTFSPCGCIAEWTRGLSVIVRVGTVGPDDPLPDTTALPMIGDGVMCPECDDDALVARIEHLATTYEPQTTEGRVVPWVGVEPPRITASAKPAGG